MVGFNLLGGIKSFISWLVVIKTMYVCILDNILLWWERKVSLDYKNWGDGLGIL